MKSKSFSFLAIPLGVAAALILLLFATVSRWTRSAHAAASLSNPAAPVEFVSSLGGSITSVAVSGTIAYVGQGGTFATFDISDPTQISRLAYIPLSNLATKIQIVGSLAYIAHGSNYYDAGGLQIVDISNPLSPQLLGSYTSDGETADLEVVGNLVYLTYSSPVTDALQILDVTDPALPVYLGGYSSGEGYNGIEVVDGLAYLAGYPGLTIIDVQDSSNPTPRGSYRIFDGQAQDVQVEGNLAVLVVSGNFGPENQLQVINISNPTTPTLLGSYETYARYDVVSVVGNFAYMGSVYDGLNIIDLTTPTTPTLSGHYPFGIQDLQIVNARAYLAGGRTGMQIVDISSPANPAHLGDYELFGFLSDVQAQPPYIYITDEIREIAILDGTDLSSPLLLTSPITPGYGRDLNVIGDFAYLNRYNYGFDIFDVTDPTSPTLRSRYNHSHGSFTGMTTDGHYAYIGELGNGLNVLDVSDPSNPQYLGNPGYISGSGPQAMKVVSNLVYVAAGNGGLVIVNASNPVSPSVLSRSGGLWASGIDVVENLAYVTDAGYSTGGLSIFDVSNPSAPVFLSKYATVGAELQEVQVVNNLAYIADALSGLWVIDVSNPLAPVLQEHYVIPGWTRGLTVVDDFIYLACGDGGLRILHMPNDSPHATSTPHPAITHTPSSSLTPSSTPSPSDTPSTTPIPSLTPSSTPTFSPTPIPSPTATVKPAAIYKLYLPFVLR